MVLKLRHNKVWTIIDGIQTVDYSDDFQSRKEDVKFRDYTYACIDNPERFGTTLMSNADQSIVREVINIEDVKYWYRAIYYLLKDGTRGSIIFDRVCYICNDNGTTIEKVPVKHNLEYYSIDKVTDRIIAQQDENIVPPIFDRPSKVNN